MVETAEVDVPSGHGETVTILEVVVQVDEAIAVTGVRTEVVEEGGAAGHDGYYGRTKWLRSRDRYPCLDGVRRGSRLPPPHRPRGR